MRKSILALSLLLAPALLGQSADLGFVNFTPNIELTRTGERFALAIRWRNHGPDRATFIHVDVTGTPAPFYLLSAATNGWPCYPNPEGTSFSCQNAGLDPGAEAELVLQMITPSAAGAFEVRAEIRADEPDPNPSNNVARLTIPQLEAAPTADLSITPTAQTHVAAAGQPVSMVVNVANNGPAAISYTTIYFAVPVSSAPPVFNAQGEGWSCAHLTYGPQAITCNRNRLESGVVAPITVSTIAPAADGTLTIHARARGEAHSDPFNGNDNAVLHVQVGSTSEPPPPPPVQVWSRILVPLTGRDVPGANGSLWRTETTALISSITPLELPHLPANAPLGRPFNILNQGWVGASPFGQFIYVRKEDEAKLHLTSRVYDVSRFDETAGSEVPIAREGDFSTAAVSIVGIPVAPQYRHTLRVYDSRGRGGRVRVRLFANGEAAPRATADYDLNVQGAPTGELPLFPAYLQLDLGQLASLAGAHTLRVDVEPLSEGLSFWSFVSVTNNATHHVTTFSQR